MTIKCNYDTRAHRINGKWKWILGAIIVQPLWSFNARYLLARPAHTINYRVFFRSEMKMVTMLCCALRLRHCECITHGSHNHHDSPPSYLHQRMQFAHAVFRIIPGSWWWWCWCLTAVSISISIIFASDCNSNKYTCTTQQNYQCKSDATFSHASSLVVPLLRSHVNAVFMQFSCGNYKMIFGFISLAILCCDWLHCTRITFLFVFTVNGGKCTFAIVFESRQSRCRHWLFFFILLPFSFDQNTTARRTFTLWNSQYTETTWISL